MEHALAPPVAPKHGRFLGYAIPIFVALLLLGTLAAIKGSQIATLMAFAQEATREGPPPETVGAAIATEQRWEETLDSVGTVASIADVPIRAEVPGVVTRVAFVSGAQARAGDVLVEIDSSVERAELQGAIADQELARVTLQRARELFEDGAVSEEARDRAASALDSARARVAMLRATIAKKVVRAPFAGRLGIRAVNVGDLVEPGTTLTQLGSAVGTYVDFSLPQEELSQLAIGMPVRLRLGDRRAQPLAASMFALEPNVDPSTRAMRLRARVLAGEDRLRPGMFVRVEVVLPPRGTVVAVPATAIVHAPYGDSVYVVEESRRRTRDGKPIGIARQHFVQTGRRVGDFVAIREGLRPGARVVSAGAFKLRNGSPIVVTRAAAVHPELAPRPENR